MTMSALAGSRGAAGNKIPKGYSAGRLQQYTPEQLSLFQSLFPYTSPGSQLAQQAAGSDQGFAPFEDYARRQFQQQTGDLASRFSGMGLGARHSSGFQNLATQGAQDFASQLALQRQGLQRQALFDLMNISNSLLGQKPYDNFLIEKQQKPSFWQQLIGVGAPITGAAIGGAFGGPFGAGLGGQIGSQIGAGFRPTNY